MLARQSLALARTNASAAWLRCRARSCPAYSALFSSASTPSVDSAAAKEAKLSSATPGNKTDGGQRLLAYYSNNHVVPLPDKHRFPMDKYSRTHANLEFDASLADKIDLQPAPPAAMEDILTVHDRAYVERFTSGQLQTKEMRNVGFPWSEQLVGQTGSRFPRCSQMCHTPIRAATQ